MKYGWSKKKKNEYGAQMSQLEELCKKYNITSNYNDSMHFFTIDNQRYVISNFNIPLDDREKDVLYIKCAKTKIVEVYNHLLKGKKLDEKGDVI